MRTLRSLRDFGGARLPSALRTRRNVAALVEHDKRAELRRCGGVEGLREALRQCICEVLHRALHPACVHDPRLRRRRTRCSRRSVRDLLAEVEDHPRQRRAALA